MPIDAMLTPNWIFSVPRGYPFTLSRAIDEFASGFIPKGVATVSAKVKMVAGVTPTGTAGAAVPTNTVGTANVHLAVFSAPTSSGGADGAPQAQTDVTGLTVNEQTITVTVPTTVAATRYIVRLWIDSTTGTDLVSVSKMWAS